MTAPVHGPATLPEEARVRPGDALHRLPWIGWAVGLAGLIGSAALGGASPEQFHFSWLVAFVYFLTIALGCLFFVLALLATNARWGTVVRRTAENGMATLPLFALLFVPIWMGRETLFEWARADEVAHDALLQAKAPYLNEGFFLARALVYFGSWTLLSLWFSRQSGRMDHSRDAGILERMKTLSAPALVVFGLTLTFASIDWLMSLHPHWYSTIFGVYVFSGSVVAGFAFLVVAVMLLEWTGGLRGLVSTEHFHDLGKLLFGFTIFWSYIAFSQYMLIWYANIPEETIWYLERMEGSWRNVTVLLAVGHFVVPFLYLMSRGIKRRRPFLLAGALWMLVVHLLDLTWIVMPVLHPHGIEISALDVTALLAVGGFWAGTFGWLLRRRALVPVRDPRLADSLAFENV